MAIKRRQKPEPIAPKKTPKRKHKYFATEKELALPVIHHLKENGFDVWQEVQFNSAIHDIVAVKDNRIHIIECKLSLTLGVMAQAHGARGNGHMTYIAVPAPDKNRRGRMTYLDRGFSLTICQKFGIGVFYVHPRPDWAEDTIQHRVSSEVDPVMQDTDCYLYQRQMKKLATIPRAFCESGGNGGGYYTPYKGTIKNVKDVIAAFPGINLSSLISELGGKHHYAHDQSARSSLKNALKKFEQDWCVVDETKYPERYYLKGEHYCHAGKDGECSWEGCPQLKDKEPAKSGRHCPLDKDDSEE